MNLSEAQAKVATTPPPANSKGSGMHAANSASALPLHIDSPANTPILPNPPWLVRNSRKVVVASIVALVAASPFIYRYLYGVFGPDPLAGVRIDKAKAAAITGLADTPNSVDINPAEAKPVSAFKPVEPMSVPSPQSTLALPPTAAGAPVAAIAPLATPMGVTHTRPGGAPPAATAANIEVRVAPAVPVREQQAAPAVANNCSEATEVLGLCNPTTKGR